MNYSENITINYDSIINYNTFNNEMIDFDFDYDYEYDFDDEEYNFNIRTFRTPNEKRTIMNTYISKKNHLSKKRDSEKMKKKMKRVVESC